MTWRYFLIVLLAGAALVSGAETRRFQLGADWCFVKRGAAATDRAILILHGNGEVVGAAGSTWESKRDASRLMDLLVEAGYVVAQSNAAAVPGNGMWGNADTGRAVLALMDHLRRVEGAKRFDAVAISAGNLTLLNLLLEGAVFEHAVLLAPVTSLASLYRCPAGVDRVRQISAAFGFQPAGGCPGAPEMDEAYRRATAGHDPGAAALTPERIARLRNTRWMAIYEERDPKVPPRENILAWKARMEREGIAITTRMAPGAETHTGAELFKECLESVPGFLARDRQ